MSIHPTPPCPAARASKCGTPHPARSFPPIALPQGFAPNPT